MTRARTRAAIGTGILLVLGAAALRRSESARRGDLQSPARATNGANEDVAPRALSSGARPLRRISPNAARAARSGERQAGDPALFGGLVSLGQSLVLAEALANNAQNAEQYVDELCDDYDELRRHSPFPQRQSEWRDAAEFMAPLIDYEKPLDDPAGRLHVPDALAARLASYGADWPAKITDDDLRDLDFGWMAQLAAFDHWSLLGAGRLRDYSGTDLFETPIPNYMSLVAWSKLRFAAALRSSDLATASTEVRHLADLLRSQGILVAEMMAVILYRTDAQARAAAAGAGRDVSGWPPIDGDQLDRYRRAAFASMYFTYPGVDAGTLRKALECMPSPCSALVEGAGANRTFGAFSASDNLELVTDLARSQGCDAALLDRVARSRELSAAEALASVPDIDTQIPRLLDRR